MIEPLVSCIMPARGRRHMAERALRSWREQMYVNKELVILDDAADPMFPDGYAETAVYYLRHERPMVIGDKRNLLCQLARGEIIAHFDSDDYSFPGRLLDQVGRLQETKAAVTGYWNMKFTDGERWWLYYGLQGVMAIGSSLCYLKSFALECPFPSKQLCEDSVFQGESFRRGKFRGAGDLGLMVATVHDGNTSPRSTKDTNFMACQPVEGYIHW